MERHDDFDGLITASLSGDRNAGARLFRLLSAVLSAYYANRLDGDAASVEDLVQDTLMAIHQRGASYDPGRPFRAWLFAVARHKLIDHLRRRRDHLSLEDCGEFLSVDCFEGAANARLDVDRLLAALPGRQAGIIRDRHLAGRSAAEAGEKWGISEINVAVTVHRGLRVLAGKVREPSNV